MSANRATGAPTLAKRIGALDWTALEQRLQAHGIAHAPSLLTDQECQELAAGFDDDSRFRKRIHMERLGFGQGSYGYYAKPLPRLVGNLRRMLYRRLHGLATQWSGRMARGGEAPVYPPTLPEFTRFAASCGQAQPTPLLLRYEAGGYNRLHQDRYGDVFFPLQATVVLSRRERDFTGGSFLFVEQRPRQQSIGTAIEAGAGDLILFAGAQRPVAGRHGDYRTVCRHGVSRIESGQRTALGIIFHDAK